MVRGLALLLLISSALNVLCQQQDQTPVVEGYVTRAVSLADFDVNGFHVISGKRTSFLAETTPRTRITFTADPYLGQAVTIYGTIKEKEHRVIAEQVLFRAVARTALSGFAVVERIVSPAGPVSAPLHLLVRADGYVILISATAKVSFESPLTSVPDIMPNVWIKYHGKQQSDGFILADTAIFSPSTVPDSEAKLLDKNDYDPAAIDPGSRQNVAKELFLGIDPKKIPPYKDAAMQARIDRIGTSLTPVYQRSLTDTDDRKILFKFQLIDEKKWKDAITLPTGIILIPYQLIERLQNDSQIATLLADNMATAIEKQTYRLLPAVHEMTAANIASSAAGILVPGVGTVTGIATGIRGKAIHDDLLNQSGRVSLGLLHDAGYDINQAPISWWLLAAKPKHDIQETTLPPRAANLYKSLGTTWRNYSEQFTAPPSILQTKIAVRHGGSCPARNLKQRLQIATKPA